MKKIYLTLILGMFLLMSVSATLPPVKQGDCVNIKTILNSSSVTLSSITLPNQTTIYLDSAMTQNGKTFNYTFCDTLVLGDYTYDYYDTEGNVYVNDFPVTPSGKSGYENVIFFIVILALLYFLTLFLFFKRDIELAPFVALSGMTLGFLGVYMINNGIIIFRDTLTNYLSYVTLGIGFGLALWSLIEWISDLL